MDRHEYEYVAGFDLKPERIPHGYRACMSSIENGWVERTDDGKVKRTRAGEDAMKEYERTNHDNAGN